jgi:nitrogen regulatory protein P-II 1
MKLVKCIGRPDKIADTTDALRRIEFSASLSRRSERGRREPPKGFYRCCESDVRRLPYMMIDVVVADCMVEDVVRIVMETARTGEMGDRRVFVPVEEVLQIRTCAGGPDEMAGEALMAAGWSRCLRSPAKGPVRDWLVATRHVRIRGTAVCWRTS